MGIVNGSLQEGYKDAAWFAANPTLVLLIGQKVNLEQTGTYKLGDGTTQLSALSFLGGNGQTSLGYTPENVANKDATGGYVGLTLFKINFKNALNTFTSFFTNSNTASRTYTFQDRNGTIADDTDLATKLTASNNLSDLANPLTALNNLKHYNFFITGGNVTTTSNVASNVTGFVTPTLTVSKRYRMSGTIHTGCNNTGGVRLQVTLPTGCTISGFMIGSNVPNASSTVIYDISAGSTFVTSAFNQSNSQLGHVNFMIDVQMSTTSGVIQFGFASGTNTQTSTIYQLGTFGILEQLD